MLERHALYCFLVSLLMGVLSISAKCQLKADFTLDKAGGCSPLLVSFKNTTTGASSNTAYEWKFDNGNSSSLKDPSAIFEQERTYMVTLTARDGNQSSMKSQQVIVYKRPSIDFVSSTDKGCLPLAVNFITTAKAGDGSIANYFWDFGDGVTQQVTSGTASHTFTEAQQSSVSVTVTNSFGCRASTVKEKIVNILPQTIASFQANETTLCSTTDAASFTNNSKGPGSITYNWDFGDGTQSTDKTPAHVFNARGNYTIKLKVTSSEGCVDSSLRPSYINAANFKSDFEVIGPICKGTYTSFKNTSQPMPAQSTWESGDGYVSVSYGASNISHWLSTSGTSTMKLTNQYGTCKDVVTKPITVNEGISLKGFIADITHSCGAPVLVNYKDTSAKAVKWQWTSSWPSNFSSSEKEPSFTYNTDNWYNTYLTVTDADGCTATAYKDVNIRKPYINISSPDIAPSGQVLVCESKSVNFLANTNETISNYEWDFGDGGNSQSAQPVHTFSKAGDYRVRLKYKLSNGCTGTVEFSEYVVVRNKVKADFTTATTEVCGNTPVTIINRSGNATYYYWDLGDGYFAANTGQYQSVTRKFQSEGSYTIRLIATDWVCADTLIKKDYIHVKPPFPTISGYTNTCEGDRNVVTFSQTSKQTDTWTWDFGDGSTLTLNSDKPQVQHSYAKTGFYKVVLRNSNGSCTVGDSLFATVLLRQKPILSTDKMELCVRESYLNISISNLEKNPSASSGYYGYSFRLNHADGTLALSDGNYANLQDMPLTQTKWNFFATKNGLQAIVISEHFGCSDTSNLVPLVLKGPSAGFKVKADNPCIKGNAVFLGDTSTAPDGVPIVSWEWNFGDGKIEKYTKGGEVFHNYDYSSTYYATLKVTNASGCSSISQGWVDARVNTLRAGFIPSATTISPGSMITFSNSSSSYDYVNTTYRWVFGDGTEATTYQATKTYTIPGTYTVQLIATNLIKGCIDTATAVITVKYVNAAFKIAKSNISNNSCPPVLVRFSNLSNNVSSIRWDFGDGTVVTNQFSPSHVYTKAGVYRVTLETTSDNNTKYTTIDSVVVNQPTALLAADKLHGCSGQDVTLTASTEYAARYFWDFGDGNIQLASDSILNHRYSAAGVYKPRLIVQDSNACSTFVGMTENIVIDSLTVFLRNVPSTICSPKDILFEPYVASVASDQAGQDLVYHWDFGTGNVTDTANTRSAQFRYDQAGDYLVNFIVRSPFGCIKQTSASIKAYQGLGGKIDGAALTCVETPVQLTASTILPGQPQWKWIFDNGNISVQQTPPPLSYNSAGTHTITLVMNNNGCMDTVIHKLQVNPKPTISLSVKQATICEGSSLEVTASGGNTYQWSPASVLSDVSGATTRATPLLNTTLHVTVTNDFGCVLADSVQVNVVHPLTIKLPAQVSGCEGMPIQLQASGGDVYKWIGNTQGLSNTTSPSPMARPSANTRYTVVASDVHSCFTDTASIQVNLLPLPTVDAGPDMEILTGSPVLLQPVYSSDVLSYNWSPGNYLSCTNCATPELKALSPTTITVSVRNGNGCISTDDVSIKLICGESRVAIPNIFTPDYDGKNDGFGIKGEGIRIVNYLRIYNRWGQQVFEKKNFMINDKSAYWDGRFKGQIVPIGNYIYVAEMSCNERTFTRKGTVMVTY